jgi:integrase
MPVNSSRSRPFHIAFAVLYELRARAPGPWAFMTPKGSKRRGDKHWEQYLSFRTSFETACRHAKLSGVTPYVLQHKFASRLVLQGVDMRTVQELDGWKSLNMVQRYAHLSQEHKRQAGKLLAGNSPTLFTAPTDEAVSADTYNLRLVDEMGR